jgi:hypothetical protein
MVDEGIKTWIIGGKTDKGIQKYFKEIYVPLPSL